MHTLCFFFIGRFSCHTIFDSILQLVPPSAARWIIFPVSLYTFQVHFIIRIRQSFILNFQFGLMVITPIFSRSFPNFVQRNSLSTTLTLHFVSHSSMHFGKSKISYHIIRPLSPLPFSFTTFFRDFWKTHHSFHSCIRFRNIPSPPALYFYIFSNFTRSTVFF